MRPQDADPTGSEQLVQRFIDQELTGEERVRLLGRLGRDHALREQVIDLERLVLEAGRLPKAIVPDIFVASVMERIGPELPRSEPGWIGSGTPARSGIASRAWRRAIGVFWTTRTFEWNLAGAAAAAGALAVTSVAIWRAPSTPLSTPTAPVAAVATPARVLVRLVVVQPDAKTVALAGDFNEWDPMRTPLQRTSSGAWTVTIPVAPGRYEYMFVVDGEQWIADPFAVEQNDDGFGSRNAVLDVRPPMGETL